MRLREALTGLGPWGPLGFIGLQVFQIIIFIIPGELVQIAGGYIFGPWLGLVYSLIGISLGSAGAFFLGRALGRPFVEALIRRERVERFDWALGQGRGPRILFLLFLIPGVPKDILCYLSGLSAIPFLLFFLISAIARLPGLVLSVIFGSKLALREWEAVIAIAAAVVILLILAQLFRTPLRALEEWLLRRLGGGGRGGS
ncbi:MAG: TVP38/TMEM64 family protein [Candidatus Bipolaricaulia bacterium]